MDTIAVCTKLAIAVEMLEKIEAGPICALSARSRNTLGWRPRWAGAGDEIPVSIVYALRRDRVDVFRKTADAETPRGSKSRLGSISRHDFQFSPTNKLVAGASELQDIENYRAYLETRASIRQKLAAHEFEETVSDVVEYFGRVEDEVERDLLQQQIEAAIRRLRKALRRA